MGLNYQRVTLVPPADIDIPQPLPPELVGLDDASLANVEAAIGVEAATQLGYLNTGFLPVADPPPLPPPATLVPNSQVRIALLNAGLLDDVETAVGSLSPEDQIAWVYNSAFRIDSPVIAHAAASVGIGHPALLAVFLAAETIQT